jgi:predicted TIM-barrel fold metal-dependent hydrolase
MFKKPVLIIFTIIFALILLSPFSAVRGVEENATISNLTDKLIELSLRFSYFLKELEKTLNSLSLQQEQVLGDYLKDLFENKGIFLSKNDFLGGSSNPYLDFAKILNLIPSSSKYSKRISKKEAEGIKKSFSAIKDKILLDGLYGKIDMHEHYRAGGNVDNFLRAAGALGVSKVLFLPTGVSPDNAGYKVHQAFLVKYITKLYPEKIIPFCTINEADPKAAEVFEECLLAGGKGLKLLGGHPNFYDEPLDSKNMYKVYEVAKKYKVPVLVHGSIINVPQTLDELKRIYGDFPEVTFIHAHYCSSIFKGINLELCQEILDKYSNVYTDLSMGGGIKRYHRYFKQDLEKVKNFIIKYQDRILFGSDIILDNSYYKNLDWLYNRIRCDIDLHQKKEYTCSFGEKDWLHQGFSLDKKILHKIYFENPKKVLNY